jgi:DNA-binding PadR family transcriptional regulator
MAATETRLLLLGAVSLFEPVNGYQIRRELMSWRVEDWAHINPGSIYSSLTTMTKQGLLTRHDLREGGREVAVYLTTEAGRCELERLFGKALEEVSLLDPLPFHTALSMCVLFPRTTVIRHLEVRAEALDRLLDETRQTRAAIASGLAPPHVARWIDLHRELAQAERSWLTEFLLEIGAGELAFAGEFSAWQPPPEDPGRQLAADRERYRALLGLTERQATDGSALTVRLASRHSVQT